MSTILQGIDFGPVWCASGARGWFGEGYWFHKWVPGLDWTGSTFVAKTTTLEPRKGNMPLKSDWTPRGLIPRGIVVWPVAGAALNAVGLSGPGAEALFETGRWQAWPDPFFLSFMAVGETREDRVVEAREFAKLLRCHLDHFHAPVGLQVNLSCVSAGTRVLTQGGYFRIADLAQDKTQILTEYGRGAASGGACSQGMKEVAAVRTTTGAKILATPDHQFKALTQEGLIEWKEVSSLAPGDFLLSKRGNGGLLPKIRGESPSFWYLIGYLYGDGSRYKHGPCSWNISENQEPLRPILEAGLADLGARFSTKTRAASNRGGVQRHETESYILASPKRLLGALPPYERKGLWRKGGVPGSLWSQGEAQIASFLRGLLDTDGCAGKNTSCVSLSTKHEQLAQDTRSLLLILGVVSQVSGPHVHQTPFGETRMFSLRTIGPRSLHAFKEVVGFSLPRKAQALARAIARSDRRPRNRILGYRNATGLLRRAFPAGAFLGGVGSSRSAYNTIGDIRRGRTSFLSEAKIRPVLERVRAFGCDPGVTNLLQDYSDHGWWFDEVASIEACPDKQSVFDIVGSSTKSYISNGVVSHNCPNTKHDPRELVSEARELLVSMRAPLPATALVAKVNAMLPLWSAVKLQDYCDGICVSNTIPWGQLLDPLVWVGLSPVTGESPLKDLGGGGLSGAPLLPVVAEWVERLRLEGFHHEGRHKAINACGGILHPRDVDVMKRAKADSVSLGTIAMLRGWRVRKTIRRAKELWS